MCGRRWRRFCAQDALLANKCCPPDQPIGVFKSLLCVAGSVYAGVKQLSSDGFVWPISARREVKAPSEMNGKTMPRDYLLCGFGRDFVAGTEHEWKKTRWLNYFRSVLYKRQRSIICAKKYIVLYIVSLTINGFHVTDRVMRRGAGVGRRWHGGHGRPGFHIFGRGITASRRRWRFALRFDLRARVRRWIVGDLLLGESLLLAEFGSTILKPDL